MTFTAEKIMCVDMYRQNNRSPPTDKPRMMGKTCKITEWLQTDTSQERSTGHIIRDSMKYFAYKGLGFKLCAHLQSLGLKCRVLIGAACWLGIPFPGADRTYTLQRGGEYLE